MPMAGDVQAAWPEATNQLGEDTSRLHWKLRKWAKARVKLLRAKIVPPEALCHLLLLG